MKRMISLLLLLALLCLGGCGESVQAGGIAATTLPVYEFTSILCQGTGIPVTQLVTESVSCLHDYALSVSLVKAIEAAQVVVVSGAGLEEFMEDVLKTKTTIDASAGIPLLESCHEEGQEAHEDHHHHEEDPHIWLAPENAAVMAQNICAGLSRQYPAHRESFERNLQTLLERLDALQQYGREQLAELSCRQLITFHDGFAYLAQAFDLEILKAVEEESGAEASARDLIELITLVQEQALPAIFTEENGSVSAAQVIGRETGVESYRLSMAMSGGSYFDAMYRNIDTLKEALG